MEAATKRQNRVTRPALFLGVLLVLVSPRLVLAQEAQGSCGAIKWGDSDPIDYRTTGAGPNQRLLKLTERDHFAPVTESLRSGKSSETAGPDIAYTLQIFPNHYRALMAMVALGEKEKTSKPHGSPYSVECWLRRATLFRPGDNVARMIYTQFLIRAKRGNEAEQQLSVAADHAGDNALTQHNVGLLYFDMQNYEKALLHAHKAYELGLGTPTLRDQLKSVGKWSEPAEVPLVESAKNVQ